MTRVVCAQIGIESGDVSGNVERAVDAIETAAADGADLVVLPEIFNVGYFAFDSYARKAEPLDGPTLAGVREAADANGVGVLAGSIVEGLATSDAGPADEGLANTSVLFDREGERCRPVRGRRAARPLCGVRPVGDDACSLRLRPTLVTADIDPDPVAAVRAEFPAWRNRRVAI